MPRISSLWLAALEDEAVKATFGYDGCILYSTERVQDGVCIVYLIGKFDNILLDVLDFKHFANILGDEPDFDLRMPPVPGVSSPSIASMDE